MIQTLQTRRSPRLLAWALAASLGGPVLAGLTGCGNNSGGTSQASGPGASAPGPAASPPGPSAAAAPSAMSAGTNTPSGPAKTGMSTRNKVILLAGAALLYYLYSRHQAAEKAKNAAQGSTKPSQLYRSSNGGVYYRDPQDPQKVTWLTVPSQPVQVPAGDVQRYAPNYQQYEGQAAPAVPAGQPQQSFTQYDPSLAGS